MTGRPTADTTPISGSGIAATRLANALARLRVSYAEHVA